MDDYINLYDMINYMDMHNNKGKDMIYWTKKKNDISVRYRAYRVNEEKDEYSFLSEKPEAEIYIFLHKENHGSCFGIIHGYDGIRYFPSKEEAFEEISKKLKYNKNVV
jgi:hypothetical protein